MQSVNDDLNEMLTIGSLMCVLSLCLAIVMTCIADHVRKLVWQTDKVIPLMLILMCCTLYSTALYFFFSDIIFYAVTPETMCSQDHSYWYNLLVQTISVLPSFFLGVGAMLNLNKWIYFYLRIRAFVKVGEGLS
jgi:hypothetical protein